MRPRSVHDPYTIRTPSVHHICAGYSLDTQACTELEAPVVGGTGGCRWELQSGPCADPQAALLRRAGERENPLLRRNADVRVVGDENVAVHVEVIAQLGEAGGGADEDAALDHAAEHGLQSRLAGDLESVIAGADSARLDQLHIRAVEAFHHLGHI